MFTKKRAHIITQSIGRNPFSARIKIYFIVYTFYCFHTFLAPKPVNMGPMIYSKYCWVTALKPFINLFRLFCVCDFCFFFHQKHTLCGQCSIQYSGLFGSCLCAYCEQKKKKVKKSFTRQGVGAFKIR